MMICVRMHLTSARGQSLKPNRLMFHSFRASSFLSWRENPSFSVSDRINLERSRINRVLVALRFVFERERESIHP